MKYKRNKFMVKYKVLELEKWVKYQCVHSLENGYHAI